MPLTAEGLEVLRTADYLDEVREEVDAYLATFGVGPIDFSRDLVLGALTAVMADRLGDLGELLQAVYDARDPSAATGAQLSSIAVATGITRNEPTYSSVVIACGGDDGTVIPAGRLIRDKVNDELWELRADVTISGGTVDATFDAQTPGAIVAPGGTTWEIITAVRGWDTATNADDATVGDPRETDDELRLRRQQSLQIGGSSSARAILAELLEVEGVTAAAVLENDDSVTKLIEDVAITGHTIAVYLLPDTLTDAQKTAAVRAIYEKKSAGIRTQGTQTALVSQDGLAPITIAWSWAVEVAVTIDLTIKIDTTLPDPPTFADLQTAILADLASRYTPGLGLSVDVLIVDVLCIATTLADGSKRYGLRSASVVITAPELDIDGNAVINAFELADPTYNVIDGT